MPVRVPAALNRLVGLDDVNLITVENFPQWVVVPWPCADDAWCAPLCRRSVNSPVDEQPEALLEGGGLHAPGP